MNLSNRKPSAFGAVDTMRGMVIAAITVLIGYFALLPEPGLAIGGLSVSRTGLYMMAVAAGLQVAILVARPLVARFENAHRLQGQLSPTVIHFLLLLADGLTVLLFALAVFGGIARFQDSV